MARTVPQPGALVEAVLRGEPGAKAKLVDAWLPLVVTWCNRLSGPKVDPEDAAHDAMVIVLTRLDTLREPDRFAGWLLQVVRGVISQHRRRAFVRRWLPGVFAEQADPRPDPLGAHEDADTLRRVREALEDLPAPQREALILCDLEERPIPEAAELLGVPVGTMKSRLRLGRERFRVAAIARGLRPPTGAEG